MRPPIGRSEERNSDNDFALQNPIMEADADSCNGHFVLLTVRRVFA
jgi:hypothetical protein